MRIYKYKLRNTISLPKGVEVLHVQDQDGEPTLWAKVDPDASEEVYEFFVLPTGAKVPTGCAYLNTLFDGPLVWHFFYRRQYDGA